MGSGAEPEDLKDDLFQLAAEIRFSPALYAGSPVAVNVVWLLAQTTLTAISPHPYSGRLAASLHTQATNVVLEHYCSDRADVGILRTSPGRITDDLRPLTWRMSSGVVP